MSQLELEDEVQDDLKAATGGFTKETDDANRLNRILQLTGFSDPVYAEAFVTVHHYDIVLDVTVINRTKETLQNLCLELATMGDLKLVDRPQNYTLAPESSKQIRANIKVSSTETGVIFGNIVYETSNVMERSVVVLNDIHIDIMDYISPATCADVTFRNMWAEFEWENKVICFFLCRMELLQNFARYSPLLVYILLYYQFRLVRLPYLISDCYICLTFFPM
jgi:coatomer subunit beta